MPGHQRIARFRRVDFDVVAHAGGREQPVHAASAHPVFRNHLFEHRLRVSEQRPRVLAHNGIIQNLRILAEQLPGVEERAPVDEFGDVGERHVFQPVHAKLLGRRRRVVRPVHLETIRARSGQRQERRALFAVMDGADVFVFGFDLGDEISLEIIREQVRAHAHGAARVRHIDHLAARVVGLDLDRGVDLGRGRTANDQRNREALTLHFLGHMGHFFQARRDQATQANNVRAHFARLIQNRLRRHHHAQIGDLIVIAAQDHADDVLADVMYIALDGRHDDLALGRRVRQTHADLFFFDKGFQMGDGGLHHARRFHHLRQEHLARAKQITHMVHAGHQVAFDHMDRAL